MTSSKTPGPGSHRTDPLSLIFGVLFLAGAGAWAAAHFLDLDWRIDWDLPHLGWIVAGGLVLAGLLGILASLRRDKPEVEGTEAVTTPAEPGPAAPPADPAGGGERPPAGSGP